MQPFENLGVRALKQGDRAQRDLLTRSQLLPRRYRSPSDARRLRDHALTAGLYVYAGLYFCLLGCLAFGFYSLLQPTRHDNPGVAAHPHVFANPRVSAYQFLPDGADAFAFAIEPGLKTRREMSDRPNQTKKHENATASLKRTRTVQRSRRDPMIDRGAQPVFGYRPWGSYFLTSRADAFQRSAQRSRAVLWCRNMNPRSVERGTAGGPNPRC